MKPRNQAFSQVPMNFMFRRRNRAAILSNEIVGDYHIPPYIAMSG